MEFELITSILIIIGIDIVLGGDNAILIAMACRNLPDKHRNKAIIIGTLLAVVCRVLLTVVAVYLLSIPFLQFVGGVLLIYIAIGLIKKQSDSVEIRGSTSLLAAIKTVVIADIIMGVDNVMAVAGAAHGQFKLVVIGLLFSIPIIVWGSKIILYLMERYPIIVYIGAAILAFTAGKMMMNEPMIQHVVFLPSLKELFPFLTILFVLSFVLVQKFSGPKTSSSV
ncbi:MULTISPECIES: TerC family protein [Bacillus]|uniref:TerC family protein n=1 Tax=Bacillus TaxID=1386 RepID=UPI000BB6DDAF|nr:MULTISPECIES: TerC family protein [Bacillus]